MKKLLLLMAFMGLASGIFAQVSKTVNLTNAGTLSTIISYNDLYSITNLTISGTIDARDFKTMRYNMPLLTVLDLSGVKIAAYNGIEGTSSNSYDYPANAIPEDAFHATHTNEKISLTTIVFPSSLSSIGNFGFQGCKGLTTVTIPSSVTSIGESAFSGCSGWITVDVNNPNYSSSDGVLYNKAQTTLIQCTTSKIGSFTIPSSVTSIGNSAFVGCSRLTTVTIPSSVTSIGESAFNGCNELSTVTIPFSVTSIGDYAFWYCYGLTTVMIPSSVTSMGDYAFYCCSGLTTVTIPSSVTSIGIMAFSGCSGLTTVTIPSSVTSIGIGTFSGCRGLTTIAIPNSVTSIGSGAFQGCSGLTSVTIPSSTTSIGSEAFYGCNGLTTVAIPSSVTSIGSRAFAHCSRLTTVTIPSSVTSIGESAFGSCSVLGMITVDSNNANYSSLDGVLYDKAQTTLIQCPTTKIGSFTIPSSVTSIEGNAFSDCWGLTAVIIPSSVTSIGIMAFWGCRGLTSIAISSPIPLDLSSNGVFYYVNKTTCTLYVPLGSKSAYQVASIWKDFTNIVEKDFTGIDPIISNQKMTIYPNPTTGKVKLVFDQIPQGGATLTVNDITGKTILTQFIHNKEEGIDLKGNSPGVYLIQTNIKDFKAQKVILK